MSKNETWVLQIGGYGWRNLREGTYEEMQKEYRDYLFNCGCASTVSLRIREKVRKPRKGCRDCGGKGTYKQWDGRGDSCMVRCGCLND